MGVFWLKARRRDAFAERAGDDGSGETCATVVDGSGENGGGSMVDGSGVAYIELTHDGSGDRSALELTHDGSGDRNALELTHDGSGDRNAPSIIGE